MACVLRNQRGQTSVEWLMLMAVAFITSYVAITGPVSTFTSRMLENVKTIISGVVLDGEMPGANRTTLKPQAPNRFKALHQ